MDDLFDLAGLGRSVLARTAGDPGITELFLKRTRWHQTVRRADATETVATGVETGAAVRVVLPDGRCAMRSVSDPTPDRIRVAATAARELAGQATPPEDPEPLPTRPLMEDPEPGPAPMDDGEGFLLTAETAARRTGAALESVPFSLCVDGSIEVWIGNTGGMRGRYRKQLRHAVLGLLPRDGGVRYHRGAAAAPARLDPNEFGSEAAVLAAWPQLSAAKVPREVPLIVHPAAAAEWVRRLSAVLVGSDPEPEAPLFTGARAAAAGVDLIDDGSLPGGIASAPFDGAGWPTRRRILVKGGTAVERIGAPAAVGGSAAGAGNLMRDSFRDWPRPGPSNLFIPAGATAAGDILRRSPSAVLVLGFGPAPTPDPLTGDLEVSGCVLDHGVPIGGIGSAVLVGGVAGLLRGLVDSASDLRFYPLDGSFGSPTLMIAGAVLSQ